LADRQVDSELDGASLARVLKEQMEPLFHSPFRLLGHVFNAALVVLILWGELDQQILLGWLSATAVVAVGRIAICRAYARRDPPPEEMGLWVAMFFVGTLAAGIVWGASSFVMWLHPSLVAHAFVAFVVGGTTAAVAMITYAHLPSLHAFLLFGGVPVAANLMLRGEGINMAMGAMVMLFIVLAMGYARRANQILHRSLILKEINQSLVGELSLARDSLERRVCERTAELNRTNANLLAEMEARRETEDRLHQAQKMEAVGQLTGGIAHDFNNLLAVIQGNAEMMSEGHQNGENLTREIEAIVRASERGAELTRQLLAFSRKQTLRPRKVQVNELIGSMIGLLERTLGSGVEIRFISQDAECCAHVDPGQLENAILNLAINARDAMPGGGELTIALASGTYDFSERLNRNSAEEVELPPAGRYALVEVRDTGSGIAEDILAKVWEPFFTTKGPGKGSGLGLSMVYGFIKQSGGHVEIDSIPGQGTTVRLFLPIVAQEAQIDEPDGRASGVKAGA
jgi:signal transduction histidine kinase